MMKLVQVSVLCIYFLTSCFMVAENKWANNKDPEGMGFADDLCSMLTIELGGGEESNGLPMFFTDPSDEGTIVIMHNPGFSMIEFSSRSNYFYTLWGNNNPFYDIFSPPPQIS